MKGKFDNMGFKGLKVTKEPRNSTDDALKPCIRNELLTPLSGLLWCWIRLEWKKGKFITSDLKN